MKIEFLINDRGELYDFKTSEEEEEIGEFRIPSIVNGVKVESIGDLRHAFLNLYDHGVEKIKKLIIEDGIKKIAGFAFSDIVIEIDTVVWAKTCLTIPQSCFDSSPIRNVEGIEQVYKIGSCAFYGTQLKRFSWPKNCKMIPHSCFAWSTIETIIGIENVEKIESCAFYSSNHLEETIFEGTGIKDIDLECLRDLKNVKKIDLSRCGAVNLLNATDPKYAEVKGKLILPYYVTEIN